MRDRILFYLNGQRIEVGGGDVFLTLSDFLRKRKGLTGTKVVCAEGDCGSCTVLVGRPDAEKLNYSAVTSCIQILFQLDASHVVTVEGLRDGDGLNPIQQAMVACHGTQCGFCTPGFVVALQGLMDDAKPMDTEKVRRGLTGNLCRCTGYDSILRAAASVDGSQVKSVKAIYPSHEMITELTMAAKEEVRIETAERKFYKPLTLVDAVRFKSSHPGCTVVAGGTDLGVVYNKRIRTIEVALSLAGVSHQRVSVEVDALSMSAGCSLSNFKRAADDYLPELGRFLEWFGSPLIRNAGTIGGNIMTGSPIGDTLPALMVLGTELELQGMNGSRMVPVDRFYTGYRQSVLMPDELLANVRIPLLNESKKFKLYKVSRRKDLDISTFGAAIWMQQSGGIIEEVRIAYGGVGPMVMRLPTTEALLRGQSPTLELFQQSGEIARQEVKPISDVRGGAEYRRTLAANILVKFWHEVMGPGAPDADPGLLAR
jgi:xanthine dehydrogenase small subunit